MPTGFGGNVRKAWPPKAVRLRRMAPKFKPILLPFSSSSLRPLRLCVRIAFHEQCERIGYLPGVLVAGDLCASGFGGSLACALAGFLRGFLPGLLTGFGAFSEMDGITTIGPPR